MALSPNFNQVPIDLAGIPLNNPTSLQFGPDGRLYVSQQDGLIRSLALKPLFDSNGSITKFVLSNSGGADSTNLVKNIPNHNDDGSLSTQANRQVTGLAVEKGPNGEVVLYVSSSDPRIGGGNSGADKNLDTNSGIISRLTKQSDGTWKKVDLVIGLPRSEENHSTNGMDIRTEIVDGQPHKIMYVVSGGNANKGAPSNNFAWLPEYYYSAAVLRVDLTQLEQIQATKGVKGGTAYVAPYVYALPTLNDPTRPNNASGQDTAAGTTGPVDAEAADTFGGNNGRNQAKYDPNGPVQVYSMGYRNAYDVVITENNNIYTFDNGPNNGWGDVPLAANGSTPITSSSQVATNYPNINVDTGSDLDPDNLHLVTKGFYAGHPNPVYASGAAAGLYWVDTSSGSPVVKKLTAPSDPNNNPNTTLDDLPSNWSQIAGGVTNPKAGVYLKPGNNPNGTTKGPDGSLVTIGSSTNGLAEYIAGKATGSNPITNVSGAEVLATVAFNGNLYFMEIVGDGTQAGTKLTDISPLLVGGTPLDVRDVEALAVGTEQFSKAIFVAQFGTDGLTALVPSTSSQPTDIDKDDDGLKDNIDPLQYDPINGTNTLLNAGKTLFWDFNPSDSGIHPGPSGEYNIGMTGWMINKSWYLEEDGEPPELFTDPALTNLDNTIRGGAPGIIQVKSVGTGDLAGTGNNQRDAIQTGFLPATGVDKFTVKVPIFNPFSSDANTGITFGGSASMGFSLGDGTASNWIGIAVAADSSAGAKVKLTYEENDQILNSLSVNAPELLKAIDDDLVELYLTVDTGTFKVTPSWRYQTQGVWSEITPIGSSPVQLNTAGPIVKALQGQNLINGIKSAPVITLTSTSKGSQPFTADFLDLTVMDVLNPNLVGEAVFSINLDSNNVQTSNFGSNSFKITNTGDKKIKQVDIDVTDALYPDAVFDPFGLAGDSVKKPLTINTNGNTGVVAPSNASYIGVGGTAGYEGLRLTFNETVNGGFESGETLGFSVDMDPNSVRGTNKTNLDAGSSPSWDVGGVSGAELIGSTYTITFTDGTTASGQLQGNKNQAGSKGLASQDSLDSSVSLTVNGLGAGVGTYSSNGPSVIVKGPAGETARVVLTKGFIQPVKPYAQFLADQLDALAATDLPANNAVEFQTVDVVLTGANQDISKQFNFSGVSSYNFAGEDQLPLGFVASVIDPANNNLPLSPVSDPIYLQFDDPENLELLYRINVGGGQVNAADGSTTPWSGDTNTNPSIYRVAGGEKIFTTTKSIDITGLPQPASAPEAIFKTERWDPPSGNEMRWEFPVNANGTYEIRLYFAETYGQITAAGQRVFDIEVEGSVPSIYDDIDPFATKGLNTAFMLPHRTTVGDNNLNLDIEFLRGIENPAIKGVEIFAVDSIV